MLFLMELLSVANQATGRGFPRAGELHFLVHMTQSALVGRGSHKVHAY